jgi:hypothetical protein
MPDSHDVLVTALTSVFNIATPRFLSVANESRVLSVGAQTAVVDVCFCFRFEPPRFTAVPFPHFLSKTGAAHAEVEESCELQSKERANTKERHESGEDKGNDGVY